MGAGGGADTIIELMAEELAAEYGWTVIPEIVDGDSGAEMARTLKDAAADGLTIGFCPSDTFTFNVLTQSEPGYKVDDFDYIATLIGTQMAAVAKSHRGWKSLSDAISAAKSGEDITFATQTEHLKAVEFYIGKVSEVKFINVPSFTGSKGVMNAIVADEVDIGWVSGIQKQGIESGELVNLVNAENHPLRVSPGAETLREVGVEFFFGGTLIAVAPKGLPDEAGKANTDAILRS